MPCGTVSQLHRYPVKSMRGHRERDAMLTYTGIVGDRVFAFVRHDARPDFPWMSARECARLLLYTPRFATPEFLVGYPPREAYDVLVSCPDGAEFPIDSEELRRRVAAETGEACELRFSEKSMCDARPLSLLSRESVDALSVSAGQVLDLRRFRPNILIEWEEAPPYVEDSLVGRILRIGEKAEVMVSKRDPRCVIVNRDPDLATSSPIVLKTIVNVRENQLGVYGVVLREGVVREGDQVVVA